MTTITGQQMVGPDPPEEATRTLTGCMKDWDIGQKEMDKTWITGLLWNDVVITNFSSALESQQFAQRLNRPITMIHVIIIMMMMMMNH